MRIGGVENCLITQRIDRCISGVLEDLGFYLVRVHFSSHGRRCLQIMIDRLDGDMLTVDDCALASRQISPLLDVDQVLDQDAYDLEMSSPGIDRPLVHDHEFKKCLGFQIKLELMWQHEGRKRYKGLLKAMEGNKITLQSESETFHFALCDILKAQLVLNDDLINRRSQLIC